MSELQVPPTDAGGGWRIYSGQRSVPYAAGMGQHNYLMLVDPNGIVRKEIHGGPGKSVMSGPLAIAEYSIEYDPKGNRMQTIPYKLGEVDRSNWVEVPAKKGLSVGQTWQQFVATAKKYDRKYEYLFAPNGKLPALGNTDKAFYSSMPTYNSNSAWRTILEENG